VREIRAGVGVQKLFHQATQPEINTNLGHLVADFHIIRLRSALRTTFLSKSPSLFTPTKGSGVQFLKPYACVSGVLTSNASDRLPPALRGVLLGSADVCGCRTACLATLSPLHLTCARSYSGGGT